MNFWIRWSTNLHRRLARAFPHEFQMRHGDDLERLGDDAAPDLWRRFGPFGLLRLLGAAALRLIAEYLVEIGQDVRYSLRRLKNSPGFTAVGVLSLALSIGMCCFFHSQMTSILGPLPGADNPQALVAPQGSVSYPYFEEYAKQKEFFTAAAAFLGPSPFTVVLNPDGGKGERIFGHLVSPEYFSTMGVRPSAGRLEFRSSSDSGGAEAELVVTERFWRTHLQADPDVVGRVLRLNGRSATIIGVTGGDFQGAFPVNRTDLFIPLAVGPSVAPELRDNVMRQPNEKRFRALFRLREGVAPAQADAALTVITRNLDQQLPEIERPREEHTVTLIEAGVFTPMPREQRRTFYAVNSIVLGLVLAMACANLAVLLLARGSQRRKETAVRLAVGAGRGRIVRQLLTESVTLALAGGVAGLLFTVWLLRVTQNLAPDSSSPLAIVYRFHWTTAVFALLVSIAAGVAFGLAPSLSAARGAIIPALKQGTQALPREHSRFGIRNLFMLFQISSALTVLLITGYIVVGYQKSYSVDAGFNTDDLYLFTLDPARDGLSPAETENLFKTLPDRLELLPEVRSATPVLELGFFDMFVVANTDISIPPEGDEKNGAVHKVSSYRIGAGYFEHLGIPVVAGREFDYRDESAPGSERETPVLINQTAAQRLYAGKSPLQQRFQQGVRHCVVVGVAQDTKSGLIRTAPAPSVYFPVTSEVLHGARQGVSIILRGSPGAAALEAATREVATLNPNLTVFNGRSFHDGQERFQAMVLLSTAMNGSLGVFGLILSSIGLFGATANSVERRRKEIGIRMALGARAGQVLRLVLKEGAVLVGIGAALGFAGAYAFMKIFSSLASALAEVFAVSADDPLILIGAPLLWAGLALLATYLPARRSMRINPVTALRAE